MLEETRLGLFCFPVDETMKQRILMRSDLYYKYHFLVAYDAIRLGFIIAAVVGIIYVVVVQIFNEQLATFIVGAGGAMFILLAILMFSMNPQ
jgi:hypothetical protein